MVAAAFALATGVAIVGTDNPIVHPVNVGSMSVFMLAIAIGGHLVRRARHAALVTASQLEQREAYLGTVIQGMPAAMLVMDERGSVHFANRAACDLFQITPESMPGLGVWDMLGGHAAEAEDSPLGALQRAAAAGSPVVGHDAAGRMLHLIVATSPVQADGSDLLTLYLRDDGPAIRAKARVSEMQADMAQIGRAAALGAMGSAIAHELNQPLTSAATYANAAKSHLTRTPPTMSVAITAIESAVEQIFRAAAILKSLRTFVRAAPMSPRWLSVDQIVEEAASLAHFVLNERRARLVLQVPAETGEVWVDRVQIQQVLVNLIHNAADAVEGRDERTVTVGATPDGHGELTLCVSDTGPGLDDSVRARLFQPFNSSKEQGLGVGLAISKSIVEAHGGVIWCEPSDAGGARFCVTLRHRHEAGEPEDDEPAASLHH